MKKSIVLLGSIAMLAFIPMSETQFLRFKLDPARSYKQTTTINTESKQNVQGQEMTVLQFVSVTTKMKTRLTTDTLHMYDMEYSDIQMELEGMGSKQKFASDTTKLPFTDATSMVLSQLVNHSFEAHINENGMIQEVFGLEELIAEATVNATGITSMYAEQFSSGFGDGGLAKNLEMVTAIWPEKDVRIGDSWANEQYTSTGLPIIVNNIYTLIAINGNQGEIKVESTLEIDKENSSTILSGMEASYQLNGSRTGTILFEVKTGWVLKADLNDSISGNITISPNEQVPDGMNIPVEFKNDIDVVSNLN